MNDDTKHYIGRGTFAIAFGLILNDAVSQILLDPTYFNLSIGMREYYRDENGLYNYTTNLLEYGACDQDFPFVDNKSNTRLGLKDYLWIKQDDYFISSDFNGDNSHTLDIFVFKWDNQTMNNTWKTEAEISTILSYSYINVALISTYFDFEDYVNPIKTYLNDLELVSFLNATQFLEISVQQNEALISDSLLFPGSFESRKFYNAKPKQLKQANSLVLNNSLAYVFVSLNRESEQYERVVYSFFDMFGYLGGLFDFAYYVGYLLVGYFNEKQLNHTILSKLYQVYQPTMISNSSAAVENRFDNSFALPNSLSKVSAKPVNWHKSKSPI